MSAGSKISILITRSEDDSRDLTKALEGAKLSDKIQYTYLPLMEIINLPVEDALSTHTMTENSWIVFTSQNAVEAVLRDKRDWGNTKIAAIGERTAAAINRLGLAVSFTPSEARAEIFASEFADHLTRLDTSPEIFLFQGNTAADTLQRDLESRGYRVKKIICYHAERRKLSLDNTRDLLNFVSSVKKREELNILCILSSLQAEYLLSNLTEFESAVVKANAQTYAIGKTTGQTLSDLGFENVHVLENSSLEEMGKAIGEYLTSTQ